jgi:hypothetical protein
MADPDLLLNFSMFRRTEGVISLTCFFGCKPYPRELITLIRLHATPSLRPSIYDGFDLVGLTGQTQLNSRAVIHNTDASIAGHDIADDSSGTVRKCPNNSEIVRTFPAV